MEYFKQNDEPLRAVKNYWKAINVDTTFCDAYQFLTDLYLRIGELDSAHFVVEKYLRIDKNDVWAQAKKARILIGLNRVEEAKHYLLICVNMYPSEGWYKYNLARSYLHTKNLDSAYYFVKRAQDDFFTQKDNYSYTESEFLVGKILFYSKKYE